MHWLAPIWLLGLIPWGILAVWLLLDLRRRVPVPFLMLWRGAETVVPPRRRVRPPPISLAMLLLSGALLIIAAAGPTARGSGGSESAALIVDRGLTMSAPVGSSTRFRQLAREVADRGDFEVNEVVAVPATRDGLAAGGDWLKVVEALAPTALDTRALLDGAVRSALARTSGAVLVLTDQALTVSDPRIQRIVPDSALGNISITHLAARTDPQGIGQVLTTVRNDSPLTEATLRVSSGSSSAQRAIALPAPGGERQFVVPIASLGTEVEATIAPGGDVAADDTAWLVRQGAWPVVEVSGQLPPALERMVRVYAAHRPASAESARVLVTAGDAAAPDGRPAVLLAMAREPLPTDGTLVIRPHAIAHEVDFARFVGNMRGDDGAPAVFAPVLQVGDQVLLATRNAGGRAVWVGFASAEFDRDPVSVILWTNIFDWLGGGGATYQHQTVHQLASGARRIEPDGSDIGGSPGLLPGVWELPDGRRVALNAPAVPVGAANGPDGVGQAPPKRATNRARIPLGLWLIVGAVIGIAIAASTWPVFRRSLAIAAPFP